MVIRQVGVNDIGVRCGGYGIGMGRKGGDGKIGRDVSEMSIRGRWEDTKLYSKGKVTKRS